MEAALTTFDAGKDPVQHQQPKPWMDARREAPRWRVRIDGMAAETGRLGLRGRACRLSRLNAFHAQAVGLLILCADELSAEGSSAHRLLERIWRRSSEVRELLREDVRGAHVQPALRERDERALHVELGS